MSYTPTDFLATLRITLNGERVASVPGLDFLVAALARAGLINLSVGQTAPTTNQPSTAWFKPAQPSWTAEGVLYLWDAVTSTYRAATPALWAEFIAPGASQYVFQSAQSSVNVIDVGTSLLAVQRAAPASTGLTLPNLQAQWATGQKLQIVDFSTGVTSHLITLTPPDGSTIMQQTSWKLRSTADWLAGITLTPSPDLNAWIIAP